MFIQPKVAAQAKKKIRIGKGLFDNEEDSWKETSKKLPSNSLGLKDGIDLTKSDGVTKSKSDSTYGSSRIFSSCEDKAMMSEEIAKLVQEFEDDSSNDPKDIHKKKIKPIEEILNTTQSGLISTKVATMATEKPKYINTLLKTATLREAEKEIVHERNVMKQILATEQDISNQPSFITPGYKKRLAERAEAARKLSQRETFSLSQRDFERKLLLDELAKPLQPTMVTPTSSEIQSSFENPTSEMATSEILTFPPAAEKCHIRECHIREKEETDLLVANQQDDKKNGKHAEGEQPEKEERVHDEEVGGLREGRTVDPPRRSPVVSLIVQEKSVAEREAQLARAKEKYLARKKRKQDGGG